ncbi:MAG: hypothetical protein AAF570_04640 [Bacteroidota bacterium]
MSNGSLENRTSDSPMMMEIQLGRTYDALIFMRETSNPMKVEWIR